MFTNRERLILLNLIPDIGSLRLQRLLEAFGDLERLWQASIQDLQRVAGIGPKIAQHIITGHQQGGLLLDKELTCAKQAGVRIVTLNDKEYPKELRSIYDPPLALYVRGKLKIEGKAAVAIVGTRRASFYGLQIAERFGYDLSQQGITVISGLARGIDAAAHRGALRAGGQTIAVLGCASSVSSSSIS